MSRGELKTLWALVVCSNLLDHFSTFDDPAIGNGTTAGNLRTTASMDYRVAGVQKTKASTDDLWDLSGETDTAAGEYKAYWLLLDGSGAASFAAGTVATSAALALAALPAHSDVTKAIAGVFVADPSCDFDDAGGLAAQGTVHDAIPAGANIGVPGETYKAPYLPELVAA